jgi:hypothetical protein
MFSAVAALMVFRPTVAGGWCCPAALVFYFFFLLSLDEHGPIEQTSCATLDPPAGAENGWMLLMMLSLLLSVRTRLATSVVKPTSI